MSKVTFCNIYLVRHGQSEANAHDIYGLDSPLTKKGESQILDLVEDLKSIHFDVVISSKKLRAVQSAKIIAQHYNLPIATYAALNERYYGVLEGRIGKQVHEEYKELFLKRTQSSSEERKKFKFSTDYESDEEVLARFVKELKKIANAHLGKTVLIMSHMAAIKNLLIYLGHSSHTKLEGQSINNSGYVRIKSDGTNFTLKKVVSKK